MKKQDKRIFDRPLIFETVYDDGNSFWFTEFDYNALCKMNKKSHRTELIGIIPGESFIQQRLYASTAFCNGKLYFAPYTAKEIAVYDFEKNKISKIKIDNLNKLDKEIHMKFFKAAAVENKVFFIPDFYPGILCYDTEADSFVCINDWMDEVEKLRSNDWGYFLDFALVKEKLVLPCACAEAVVVLDLNTHQSRIVQTANTRYFIKYCGICYTGSYLYLMSADGMVSKREGVSLKEIKRIKLPVSQSNDVEFYPAGYKDNFIYLFPFQKNQAFVIDIRTDQVTHISISDGQENLEGDNFRFLTVFFSDDALYTVTGNSRTLIQYNVDRNSQSALKPCLSSQDQKKLEAYKKSDFTERILRNPLMENRMDALEDMIGMIQHNEAKILNIDREEKGKEIYKSLSGNYK